MTMTETAADDRADKGLPWSRLYADWLMDFRVQSMSEAMQRRHIALLCLHTRGLTDPPDAEVIFHLRLTPKKWAETKRVFIERGFLAEGSNHLVNWERRQYKSDLSTERVRKHRLERMKRPETVSETPPDTETDTDTEIETETPTQELPDGTGGCVSAEAVSVSPGPEPGRFNPRLLKQIGAAYARVLPKWPPIVCSSSGLQASLRLNIAADPKRSAPEFWAWLFQKAAASAWLNGPEFGSRSLDWLVKPETVDKLAGGMFQGRARRASAGGGDPGGNWAFLQSLNRETAPKEITHDD